jgi:hypothetical protein
VNAEGNRVAEGATAQQKLTGTATKTLKVESVTELTSYALYSTGAFTNSGPVPPRAEEVTTYTIVWHVENGTNAITDGRVSATLPPYVTWLDLTTSAPVFTYNPQTKEISWRAGDLKAGEGREASFQVSVRPSVSQEGEIITLVNRQSFRATDRFTGTVLTSEGPAITTKLFADPKYERDDGRVQEKD